VRRGFVEIVIALLSAAIIGGVGVYAGGKVSAARVENLREDVRMVEGIQRVMTVTVTQNETKILAMKDDVDVIKADVKTLLGRIPAK